MDKRQKRHELFQTILKNAFESESPPPTHPVDDEDLLLRWSNRRLSAEEHERIIDHLAKCSDCRKSVAEMIKNGVLEFHDADADVRSLPLAAEDRKHGRSFFVLGAVMSASLCLLIGFFFLPGNPDSTDIARHTGSEPDGGVKIRGMTDDSPQTDKFAVLVGIDKYGKLKESEWLDGCRNDIEAVKRIITERFGFDEKNVTVLLDDKATAAAVREQLRNLTRKVQARPQDALPAQVLFYFSGHGSRIPDGAGEDGFGATLVVYDSERQGSDTDIPSAELNRFSHDLCKDGRAELLIALDSCHSGGGARGITKFRGIDRDFRHDAALSTGVVKSAPRTLPDGLVFLSACQSNQKEPEYRHDGKTYGLFTYHLVKLLESEQVVSSLDYKTLTDAIRRSYQRSKIPQAPTPTVEGDVKKTVFGVTRFADRKPYWEANRNGSDRDIVRLEAGSTSGITKLSLFELYDTMEKTLDPAAESLGWFEIEKVDGVFSLGKFFQWTDNERTKRNEIALPKGFNGGFAVKRYHDYGDNILAIRLIDAETGKTLEPDDETVPAPIRAALTVFEKDESPWIEWVGREKNCDLVLKFDIAAGIATLFPATGSAEDDQANSKTRDLSSVPEALRGGWGPIEWGPEAGRWNLREHCRKIMVGLSLKRLVAEKSAPLKTRGENAKPAIETKIFRLNGDGGFDEVNVDARRGIVLECSDGKKYQLRIKNNDERPFYVTVLAIDPNMEISQLSHGPASNPTRFSAKVGTDNNPDANKLEGNGELVSNFRFAEPFGLQTLIVLATREPSNFSSFVQSGLGQVRGDAKGSDSSGTSRVFRFINEQCSLGKRAVVDDDVPRDDAWTVGTVDVIAEPGR